MADTNQTDSGADEPRDPAENIAGNPAAGARTPGAPLGEVPVPVGAAEQGGSPTTPPDDAHAAAAPGASAPPPPGPAAASSTTPEQQAKIEEMKAKIAALKAQKEGGAPAAAAAAPAADAGGGDAAKEAKLAEMRAKIEAAKAGKAPTGGAGAAAPAAAPATTATAAPAVAKAAPSTAPRKPLPQSPFAKTAQTPAKTSGDAGVWYFGRRNFMQSIGWMSFFGFFSIMIIGTLRAMFPRVIYEKPPVFKAGFPNDFVPGAVSEKYKDEERVWIIRQTDGSFIGLLAICTHLGCTPRWLAAENKFKCPCHGSGFRGAPNWGVHFEGPAPRPLERVAIHLAPDGQIEIDKSKKFLWEKGEWEDPAATLKA